MWRDGAIDIDDDDDHDHTSQWSKDLNGQGDYSDDDDDDDIDDDDDGDDSDVSNSIGQPLLTYVGSSNFSERSWSRDFELGFLIRTTDRRLQNVVTEEYRQIMRHCTSHHCIDNTSYDDDDDASQSRNGSIDSRGETSGGRTESNYRHVLRSMRLIPPPLQQKSSSLVPEHGQWKQRMLHSMSRVLRSFL